MPDTSHAVPQAPTTSKRQYAFDELFPAEFCSATIAELNAWTSVADVAAAARCLADAPGSTDQFDRRLILPFPDDDAFEAVVVKSIGWLIDAYRTPEAKIVLAALDEPALTLERAADLAALRFKPKGDVGPPGAITAVAPGLVGHSNWVSPLSAADVFPNGPDDPFVQFMIGMRGKTGHPITEELLSRIYFRP